MFSSFNDNNNLVVRLAVDILEKNSLLQAQE